MANTKKELISKLSSFIIFTYLVLFPFGQLLRREIIFYGATIPFNLIDLVVGLALLLAIFGKLNKPTISKYVEAFIFAAIFSLILSLTFFEQQSILRGSLFLIRFSAYYGMFLVVYNYAKEKSVKSLLFNSLMLVTITLAFFGWLQFFWLPDLRSLKLLGWDDHYFRLQGTLLDPAFTGIIFVFGTLAAVVKYTKERKANMLLVAAFLIISVIFTYSRASYLALFVGLLAFIYQVKSSVKKIIFTVILTFVIFLPLIPSSISEGAKLTRTYSIVAKYDNYIQTSEVFRKSPVFGIGYNNICLTRVSLFGDSATRSHACSGSDSSLFLVLATTGVVGFMIFLTLGYKTLRGQEDSVYKIAFLSSSAALLVHSLFVNSLFYPWVMGYMVILLGIGKLRSERKG